MKTFLNFVYLVLITSAILVGVGRFLVPGHNLTLAGTYEAFAHIWVGFFLALTFVFWKTPLGNLTGVCLLLLTALETVMFLLR